MARPRTSSDEEILQAAGRAVARGGPAGLTLADVAAEAGLTPAALVRRFGSKRGLLLALARRNAEGAAAPFDRARRDRTSPLDALSGALAAMASGVGTPEEMANSLGFLRLDLTDPGFRAPAAAHTRKVREEIAALLADAVAEGELTADVEVDGLAASVQHVYNGVLIVWGLTGDGSPAAEIESGLARLLRPYLGPRAVIPDRNRRGLENDS
ncbi:TetR/AcrR family transcriptional regulator [Rhizohabitans arisaemae]|uniref:TetR/AcrR family transcriptional regulator n=1 Tax=Rhizohabitans arisaemae TaxID=2720610 RepID=UPI0024B041C9|nr:TetR/AcrR family transcriptional regulator [Rhizohabitans arisaemae]